MGGNGYINQMQDSKQAATSLEATIRIRATNGIMLINWSPVYSS